MAPRHDTPREVPMLPVSEVPEMLGAPVGKALATAAAEPFAEKFTILLPEKLPANLGVPDSNIERSNQQRMYELREALLQTPAGERYAWVPQAIEAYRRSANSDLLPDFGTIRSVEFDPATETVKIICAVSKEQAESSPRQFIAEVAIKELEQYSLERALSEAEQDQKLSPIAYSEEMQQALAKLKPGARYRWDLVARTARSADLGYGNTSSGELSVRPAYFDLLAAAGGAPVGVGATMKNNRSERAQSFFLAKVTREEVPTTPAEKLALQAAFRINSIMTEPGPLRDFFNLACSISTTLVDYAKEQSGAQRLADRVKSFFSDSTFFALKSKLEIFIKKLMTHQTACFSLKNEVDAAIYQAKCNSKGEAPFEIEELPLELANRLDQAILRWAELINEFDQYMKENKTALEPTVQAAVAAHKYMRPATKEKLLVGVHNFRFNEQTLTAPLYKLLSAKKE